MFFKIFSQNGLRSRFCTKSNLEIRYSVLFENQTVRKARIFWKKKQIQINIVDVMIMTQARMSILYDKKHKSSKFIDKTYVKLIKMRQSEYHIFNASSLITRKLRLYFIKKKSGIWSTNWHCQTDWKFILSFH